MRDYSKVGPKFWIGKTGKALRKQGPEALIVGLYLMTSPTANMLGLYYLSVGVIAHETGLGLEGASKGLQRCVEAGFCAYDEDSEVVWVYEMASYQIAESLEVKDNRCKGVQNEYDGLPDNPYLWAFFDKYRAAFKMEKGRGSASPSEAPSKPLLSQEQEQEQEQKQDQEQKQKQDPSVDRRAAPPDRDVVPRIFEFWQEVMKSPTSKLDKKRIDLIRKALDLGYTARQLCEAVRGCALSPFHMGDNDRKTKYNGVNLIFRSADNIDKFILLADGQAVAGGEESIEARNARIMAELAGETLPSDANTIEMEAAHELEALT